ncbi:Proteasome assembly chaperone 4, partial [Heterocephalus glaber]
DPIPVCTSLLGDTSDTAPTGLAQRLGRWPGGPLSRATRRGGCGQSWHGAAVCWAVCNARCAEFPPPQASVFPLAVKTNKQVFVSYNLQNTDSDFALLVENRIKEEMEAFPEKF